MAKLKDYRDGLKEWLNRPRQEDDDEPDDPRRDCPWKCRLGDPKCICVSQQKADT